MDILLFTARVVLALILLASGVLKAVDRAGSRRTAVALGAPRWMAELAGTALPVVELAIAVGLLFPATATSAAALATVVFGLFAVVLAANVARGRRVPCHCFGRLSEAPMSWRTVVRNAVLMLVAGFAFAAHGYAGPVSAWQWLTRAGVVASMALVLGLVLLAVLAVLAYLTVGLLGQNGRLLLRVEALESARDGRAQVPVQASGAGAGQPLGLPVGAMAPGFDLPGLDGGNLSLDAALLPGLPVLLVFADPGCAPCRALMPEIAGWQRTLVDRLRVIVVGGADPRWPGEASNHGLDTILLQHDRQVGKAYQALGTPAAVLVRPDGRIGSGVANGADQIRRLVQESSAPRPLGPGQPVPDLTLRTADGESITLAERLSDDTSTVLLFWSPGCGYCQRMSDELRTWADQTQVGTPHLIVISSGGPDEHGPLGDRVDILLDEGFAAGRACGTTGTPSALLVGADGVVASPLAVGSQQIMTLLSTATAKV